MSETEEKFSEWNHLMHFFIFILFFSRQLEHHMQLVIRGLKLNFIFLIENWKTKNIGVQKSESEKWGVKRRTNFSTVWNKTKG